MTATPYLRTSDLAREVQISVQQVRNYEAGGFLPTVERSPSGYRRYTPQHLAALKTAKQLIGGYGWPRTRQIMGALHGDQRAAALALIDERHAELAATRQQLAETLTALSLLTTQLPTMPHPRAASRLRVGAAAQLVGVRVSALRFWEQQGLLRPVRDDESKYRLYDEQQLRRLRIVALLRQANYDFPAIHTTLNELEAGEPQRAVAAVEQRRSEVAATSWRCIQALATLHGYINEFLDRADKALDKNTPPPNT